MAEGLGWNLDKILGLKAKTKIDGKEGTATLRDLIKSYQLEGHLNQKLMTHADELKAFESKRQTFAQESQHKLMQMDAALQVATKMLQGEFAQVNWQQLQDENPLEFNQRYVQFQQRQAQLNQIADTLGQERKQSESKAAAERQAYLAEQMRLLETKVPEWADSKHREKEIAEMSPVMKDKYGISEQEIRGLSDHRELLILRDAWQWQRLQQQKPVITNKVKVAPKLIKPGTTQSKAALDSLQLQGDRKKLAASGKVRDATPVLKKLLFNR